jgi:hypothetical protein
MQEIGYLQKPEFILAERNSLLATFFLFREGKICGKSEDISRNPGGSLVAIGTRRGDE